MGRTKIRGIELAGIRIAVEAPSWLDWTWPHALQAHTCLVSEPDVYISVRLGAAAPAPPLVVAEPECVVAEPERCEDVSEVDRCGDDWVIALQRGQPLERVARFDPDFGFGEIVLSPAWAVRRMCPIARPLEEWIVAQRALRSGGLVVWGSTAVRGNEALVFLGDQAPADSGSRESSGGWLVLRSCEEGFRVWALPSPGRDDRAVGEPWVRGIHVADSMFSDGVTPNSLDADSGAAELLRFAYSPAYGCDGADRMLETASKLSQRISVIRTGITRRRFAWQHPRVEATVEAIAT